MVSPKPILAGSSLAALTLFYLGGSAMAQTAPTGGVTTLPGIEVDAPKQTTPPRKPKVRVVTDKRRETPVVQPQTEAQVTAGRSEKFDTARQAILAPAGATTHTLNRQAIEALPQGTNASLDKVLLQFPGVTQDSAASGDLHVRNEHANLQYRINGVMLPDGVGAFGQILDTGIVGSLSLLTGALPAQYGQRTAGVLDIQTKADAFNNTGVVGVYGGSNGTISTNVEYGGTVGQTQYFLSGRFLQNNLGIENPTPSVNAIHDRTNQEKGFLYLSTMIDPTSRLTFMSGVSNSTFQIPNNPGQTPNFTAFGVSNFDSSQLNEHQNEFNQFNVVAYQTSNGEFDTQTSYFNRYSQLHFYPDTVGDLVFNGVSSDVYRQSVVNGIQQDTSWRVGYAHTLRFGFSVSAERTLVNSGTTVLPLVDPADPTAGTIDAPFSVFDSSAKTGWLIGTYVQDEWKITNNLTLNAGLRFDQMYQYVDANQLSPRVSLTWKPFDGTTFHAGYARNFTPPSQVIAAPVNLALVTPPGAPANTQTPEVGQNSPVQPERSHVFDVGVVQKIYPIPGLEVGADAYYKKARDLLDDGQFGAAYVLSGFNYDRGENVGVELKSTYHNGNFSAYANLAWAKQIATSVVSNQYLFGADELAYIAGHYVYTDHAQMLSGSAGASYLWEGTRYSVSMIYGSGLRSGFANTDHLPGYTQVNFGLSHDFNIVAPNKPTTVRFDVVNAFDTIYQIRDGSGIGVFAPQYGPRRGFYAGISQRF
ncbi:ligand-gated channel [Bradyrhizobium sp. LTSP849]|uniref:TonB-dependent receptor n=1 Tax=unclassified Bradyrhizobium TaxID=2631580 RepID=UPI0005D2D1DA|nr:MULTISPECIES: TonB-dependent receptor [unclassified Bradyrhizobium]KJC43881.1 ligand-gated channel [Bradyrhizobium sp. LTSP857]KJC53191.1 ligand-gated channel [Bradyrhizobium sp. LTSP849]